MKIGFISTQDPDDRGALSGVPHAMRGALTASGFVVTTFVPAANRYRWYQRVRFAVARLLPPPLKKALKPIFGVGRPKRAARSEDIQEYRQIREEVARESREISKRLRGHDLDLIFGCCISGILSELNVDVPIVYSSDTTARYILESYPAYQVRSVDYWRACEEVERMSLQRASAVVLATDLARRSAINDYGVAPERAFTVPLGANVADDHAPQRLSIDPPSRKSLNLVITAADPVRKRVDLAIDVLDELRQRGWAANLEIIGPPIPRALAHPYVRCQGFLSLRAAADRRRNLEALARSHLMILPSIGEAFGIAACEAALLGRPSIVSSAGGLPEVVLDGLTGIVMGTAATAQDYAGAIVDLASQPDRYRAMALAAQERACAEFTWERWRARLVDIIDRVQRK